MTVRRPAGAASSVSAGARGRPHGSIDIAPRVPRAVMAASTEIAWNPDNPYRGATASRARYELYKSSQTIGSSRSSGATPQDLKVGIQKAYGQLG